MDTQEKPITQHEHEENVQPNPRANGSVNAEDLKHMENATELSPKQMRRVRHLADWRLIPALSLMYGISLMDRKNVSNAAIAGMLKDLKLTSGYGYSTITLMFFTSYVIFQPAMTVLCRKLGPKIFLSSICMAWGAVIIGFGFVHE